jgi:hypothetical protein
LKDFIQRKAQKYSLILHQTQFFDVRPFKPPLNVKLHKMQFPTLIFQHFELIKFLRDEWMPWVMCTMVSVVKTGENIFFSGLSNVVKMFSFLLLSTHGDGWQYHF